MTRPTSPLGARRRGPLVTAGALVVLLLAMVVSTKFLTPSEAEALRPQQFEAKSYVAENFDKVVQTLTEKGTDLSTLAPAVDADPAAAGAASGVDMGGGKFAFPVEIRLTCSHPRFQIVRDGGELFHRRLQVDGDL